MPALSDADRTRIQDAGGVQLASGARLRHDRVFRISGMLVTRSQLDELRKADIEAVVDMRGHSEERHALVDWARQHGVAYHHQPIEVGDPRLLTAVCDLDADAADSEIRAIYRQIVGEFGAQIVQTLRVITRYRRTAFGCAAGRDRTGIVAALLQSALGADDDAIVKSYLSAAPNPERIRERIRDWIGIEPGAPLPGGAEVLSQARASWLMSALEHARREHGSVHGYLAAHGLEPDALPSLARALVTP